MPLRAVLVLALVASACTAAPIILPARPAPPDGWHAVASDDRDVRLDLPGWIQAFDTRGAIFANEVVVRGSQGIQVRAVGPHGDLQPGVGQSTAAWLQEQIASPIAGRATVRTIGYPAGPTVVVERVDGAGTPGAWRLAAYAIRTSTGTALLVVDGPEAAWDTREAELALIPQLALFDGGSPATGSP